MERRDLDLRLRLGECYPAEEMPELRERAGPRLKLPKHPIDRKAPGFRMVGDLVTVVVAEDPPSWMQGTISLTLAKNRHGTHAVHVVTVTAFKGKWVDPWQAYTGVPQVLVRESRRTSVMEFIDTWPRRQLNSGA